MGAATALDLSGLYRSPVLRSRLPVPSHRDLRHTISSHDLTWGRGPVNTSLFRRTINHVSVMSLGYGAEVEIHAESFEGFSLVQMPLRGVAEFISDGRTMLIRPGEVAIVSPRREVRTLWHTGCEQLIVKVPHALFDGLSPQDAAGGLAPAGKLVGRQAAQWLALIQQLLELAPSTHPAWLRHVESGLALFLLCHTGEPLPPDEPIELGGLSRPMPTPLRQAQAHVLGNLDASITLADLAAAAGLSQRALHVLCRRHLGESPMTWVRNLRLDAARRRLLAEPRSSVTEVALEHGFTHLGRFSAYYRARFAELPSVTGSG
ncbi:AraC family transcriptional regulator [Enemella sp. A6]|uniref:AraC family transcriptional regulator n=1 Tax=Enemella sp. A6 TaxID=3440152 RepID=UPI003EBD605D